MENKFITTASLIGDPTRASIMWALLDGKALTATELTVAADTSPQNISMHLAKLVEAGLLSVERQGRHRYYSFSRREIAYAIEAMANLIPHVTAVKKPVTENTAGLTWCRSCYDHLAGKIGVSVTNSLLRQKIIMPSGKSFDLSKKGEKWFGGLGIDVKGLQKERRSLLRPCLDWSERQHHMAGSLAAALLDKMLSADWVRKTKHSRIIIITGKGRQQFYNHFRIHV